MQDKYININVLKFQKFIKIYYEELLKDKILINNWLGLKKYKYELKNVELINFREDLQKKINMA